MYTSLKKKLPKTCLLYTSDAADEARSVDLGWRRHMKEKTPVKESSVANPPSRACTACSTQIHAQPISCDGCRIA
ncbi:hypothetical protein PVA38_10795 [Streptococcus pneumoniae D39]|nr:hypothetical protein PVA38_10795 [Streptococcus pneumoniae D39]